MKKTLFILMALVFASNISVAQWVEQNSGTSLTLYSVSAVSDNVAWACGSGGTVLRTVNGGTTWTNVTGSPIPASLDLYNIFGWTDNIAFVTGSSASNTFVYRTVNGGTTWTQVFSELGGFINVIHMFDDNNGFMQGDPVTNRWSLWRTADGGSSWDSTGMFLAPVGAEHGWNNSIFVSGNDVYMGTNSARVYYSGSGGTNFTAQLTGAEINTYAIWFNSASVGLAGGTTMLLTTNGGTTWGTIPAPGTSPISGIIGSGNNWWYVRQDNAINFSNNNGSSWSTQYTAPAGAFTHISKSRTGNSAWAVRTVGGICKNDNLVGVVNVTTELPSGYQLSQNYPNPFNPSTTINFSIPENSFVKLRVFDMLGREVESLVNEQLSAGSYLFDFNAENLNSGIYFYSIEAGSFIDTKKMILVK